MKKFLNSLSALFLAVAAVSATMFDSEGTPMLIIVAVFTACIIISALCAMPWKELSK